MRRVPKPSGMPPPEEADGLDLRALAARVTDRCAQEFPEEEAQYEPGVWRAWCTHDCQHLLQWGVLDVAGVVVLEEQVAWLARVLAGRGYPLPRLARGIELCADVVAEEGREDVATRLRAVAGTVG